MRLSGIVYYTIPSLRDREMALLENLSRHGVPPSAVTRFEGIDGKSCHVTRAGLDAQMRDEGFPEFAQITRPLGDCVYFANVRRILTETSSEISDDEVVMILEDDVHLVRPWQDYVDCVARFTEPFNLLRFHCWIPEEAMPAFREPPACEFHPDFTREIVCEGEHGLCVTAQGCERLLSVMTRDVNAAIESDRLLLECAPCYSIRFPSCYPQGCEWIDYRGTSSYREEVNVMDSMPVRGGGWFDEVCFANRWSLDSCYPYGVD